MGNNELMQLQFPRTFYFFNTAWDREYEKRPEPEVLLDLAGELYPDHKQLIAESFLGLRENDPNKIKTPHLRASKRWSREETRDVPVRLAGFCFPINS